MIDKIKRFEELHEIAKKQGGCCLSPNFLGMKKKHLWECAKGHQWEAVPRNIKFLGRWCPICGRAKSDRNRRRHTLEGMQELARSRGGLCLSSQFESVIKKLIWQCEEGHTWQASPHRIKAGGWCPVCAQKNRAEKRKTHTIEKMQVFASNKGGRCLSQVFVHVKAKLLWQCAKGHQWQANPDNVINGGKWCPICAGNRKKTIEDMQKLAVERGGKCLSIEYQGVNKKLFWECFEGHQWETLPSIILRGNWCPNCSAGLGERICREFFEQLLGYQFKKCRPEWLRTPDGHLMELDGYCPQLKLAFEHQGLQHYKRIKYFHSSEAKLLKTQNRDQYKRELCEANGIALVEVPSILDVLGIDNVKNFIRKELLEKEIFLPSNFNKIEVNLQAVYCPNRLGELQTIAASHKGKLISKHYLGIFEYLEWECAKGHHFKAAPNNVKNSSSWCPKCSGKGRNIQDMQIIANERGGSCLSEQYINSRTPLMWKCQKGHQWQASPSNVFFGTWCPECGKKKSGLNRRTHTIEEMQEIAASRGGKCLSLEYLGTKQKLLWECKNSHRWGAKPEHVFRAGTWCPICAGRKIQ